MPKEQFLYPETAPLFKTLEAIAHRSGVSRAQAFENTLQASTAALAAETMEEQYFEAIAAHTAGRQGERGVDLIVQFFGQLVHIMSQTNKDVLGDLFQGAISYGENGLFLTSEDIGRLLAELSVDGRERTEDGHVPMIHDPCGGTGRLLQAASEVNPHAELVGMDIDARCARIMAINFGLRGKYGWVICGNALSFETQFVYRIGSFFHEGHNGRRRGVVREVPREQCPVLPPPVRSAPQGLFEEQPEAIQSEQTQEGLPEIIEVPQWVFRLEQRLAALEETEQRSTQQPSVEQRTTTERRPANDDEPKKQQTLF